MAFKCKLCEQPVRMYSGAEMEENAWKHLYSKHQKEFSDSINMETEDMMDMFFVLDDKIVCKDGVSE